MPMSPGLMRNRGIFGSAMPQQMAAPQQMAKNTSNGQTEKRGFDWGKLLGVLGDSLSIAGGGQATFVPGLLEQRQRQQAQAYAAQQQEQQRQQGLQDWVWKQQFEAQNRPPTSFEQILDAAGIQGEERVNLLRMKAQNDAQGVPVGIDITNSDGSVGRQYVRPGSLGMPQQVPQAPVGKLKPYGGQSATPTGNFPR